MKQWFDKLADSSAGMPNWRLLIISYCLIIANNFLWAIIASKTASHSIVKGTEDYPQIESSWWLVIIVVPVLETVIFQYALLHLFLPSFPPWIAVLLSALVFGLNHYYNPFYFSMTTISGAILGFVYYAWWKVKGTWQIAFCFVSLIHCLVNTTTYLFNQYK